MISRLLTLTLLLLLPDVASTGQGKNLKVSDIIAGSKSVFLLATF